MVAGALALLAAAACGAEDRAPEGVRPGRRLPWPEAARAVEHWGFAAKEEEIALETAGRRGPLSVTVWSVVIDGRLYVATDSSTKPKLWVQRIDRRPEARVGIRGTTYPVRARRVVDQAEWDTVATAYRVKYAGQIGKYDFPAAGDTRRGRIYRLESRAPARPQ
jgi:hypothetical protein